MRAKEFIIENPHANYDTIKVDHGSITIWPHPPYAPRPNSVIEFYVDDQHRNKGIGDKLVKMAMKKYDNIGAQCSSVPSLKVFFNNGFRNPRIPDASFDEHVKAWEENGQSLFMANLNDEGMPYV